MSRELRSDGWLTGLTRDTRRALRLLVRDWRFSVAAVSTLAAGIAGVTAVFTIVHSVILRPLPYPHTDRLVHVHEMMIAGGEGDDTDAWRAASAGDDWRERTTAFEALAAYWAAGNAGKPIEGAIGVSVQGARVTPNFFSLLEVRPQVGRDFTIEDARRTDTILISDSFWRRYLGGAGDVVGQMLGGRVVIGVMPPDVSLPFGSTEYWLPVDPGAMPTDAFRVGRLRPGLSVASVRQDLTNLIGQIDADYRRSPTIHRMVVDAVSTAEIATNEEGFLWALLGCSAGLLLIAVINVGSLVLNRGVARGPEFQIRTALGMNRGQLFRQLFAESLVFTVVGGLVGMWLAQAGVRLLVIGLGDIPRIQTVSADLTVVALLVATLFVASLAFSVLAGIMGPRGALRCGPQVSGSMRNRLLRQVLVAVQVAATCVLLVGAAFLGKSLWNIVHVSPGFDTHGLVTAHIELPSSRYQDKLSRTSFYKRIESQLGSHPDVESAAFVSLLPLVSNTLPQEVEFDGQGEKSTAFASPREVTGDYFRTLGVALPAGRSIGESEQELVVSESLANRLGAGRDIIGETVGIADSEIVRPYTVVGLAPDAAVGLSKATRARVEGPQIFQPCDRCDELVLRLRNVDADVERIIASALGPIDPTVTLSRVRSLDSALSEAEIISDLDSRTKLLGLFSGMGLFLALVGVYGTTAYTASRRARETGIRIALGASRARVVRETMSGIVLPLTLGLASGLWSAFNLVHLLENFLFETTPSELSLFLTVALTLSTVVILADFVAAWRHTSVEPSVCLRVE